MKCDLNGTTGRCDDLPSSSPTHGDMNGQATSTTLKSNNVTKKYPYLHRMVDGIFMTRYFPEENLRSAIAYSTRPGDLFVASYMKCGTTWMQTIVYAILNDGVPPPHSTDFMLRSPYIDLLGAEAADKMPRPGAIKTHLPFEKVPYSPDAKYIYVTRNPYDCCVSFYHHMLNAPFELPQGDEFDAFLNFFIEGKVPYGCYFRHLISWYEQRNDANVLFVTFEDLKKDTRAGVLKVADFVGRQYGGRLRHDPQLLAKVLKMVDIEEMRKVFDDNMFTLISRLLALPPDRALQSFELCKQISWTVPPSRKKDGLIRKGLVGDHKNYFSSAGLKKMRSWITSKTKNSDVMLLWKDLDLP